MTPGDAFLVYLKIFGFHQAVESLPSEVSRHVARIWDEFVVARDGGKVAYLEDPAEGKTPVISELKSLLPVSSYKPFRV